MTLSQYRNKSNLLIESARILASGDNPVAIPHCAYYSCYQLMMHIWLNAMGKTDAELKQLVDAAKSSRFINGSHNVLINEIVKYVKADGTDRNRNADSMTLNKDMHTLKKIRTDADYMDTITDMPTCRKSIQIAEMTIPILEKYM